MQNALLRVLFFLIWALALMHVAAELLFLYWTYRWLDVPMHFLGGMWLGFAGLWLWYYSGYLGKGRQPNGRAYLLAVCFGLIFGLCWELYEFVVWQLTGAGLPQNYVADTQLDVLMDVSGALTAGIMFMFMRGRAFRAAPDSGRTPN